MNKVEIPTKTVVNMSLKQLCSKHTGFQLWQTAFIGSIGPIKNELFLITYNQIVLAKDPMLVWSDSVCLFEIHNFVNVEIKIC